MKIIQPMLNAIRNNDFAAMYKYEDIMINLDELLMNHKKDMQYGGRVKAAMSERLNTMAYKQQEIIESMNIEIVSLGIFDSFSSNELFKIISKIVKENPLEQNYNALKLQVIQQLVELSSKEEGKKSQPHFSKRFLPLLEVRQIALKQKKHTYDLLKEEGFIKDIWEEMIFVKGGI